MDLFSSNWGNFVNLLISFVLSDNYAKLSATFITFLDKLSISNNIALEFFLMFLYIPLILFTYVSN